MDELYKKLQNFGHAKTNIPLGKFTTFKIGGPAKYLVEVTDSEKLGELLTYLTGAGEDYFILAGGSNLLLPDAGLDKVVIQVKTTKVELLPDNQIFAEAGAQLAAVVALALRNTFTGMEWGIGVPGSVGGAVRGNAGAMGQDTWHVLVSVRAWQNSEVRDWKPDECGFAYRTSDFKTNGALVLSAIYQLTPGERVKITTAMQTYLKQRTGRYPSFPSAGSFFKNNDLDKWKGDLKDLPPLFIERKKIPTGWLIEQCKLTSYTVGGAKISDEHGNFLINFNNATQADVLAVMEKAQTEVYNRFGINLEPEVEIVKN
ncbi:MAG: UDP-N-acetylenolpyruvoylglucosamine reductase [Candidatus Magasanikbacteria bacterium RIFOXYC2_FULL_42_28]|uniref:UDP-N-acetylenolpyruvoylglucosamine reductase n=1 Tax=Candidatus Magasanikbacteria bacterium RIFOXYC2_FULL_42_28 TaxID=1798704 RepID=A0A1F6NWH7_9BACT|nr:MAG: UDP-N-acetylenolpyruvoylglucosamine reductase [Candidatus Magasanikbacteria bacterium RIFOXYC2_FULL_42_28]